MPKRWQIVGYEDDIEIERSREWSQYRDMLAALRNLRLQRPEVRWERLRIVRASYATVRQDAS